MGAILLLGALAGGLSWIATRLNRTERQLVGVWENVTADDGSKTALFLLADGRMYSAGQGAGEWNEPVTLNTRWSASAGTWTYSQPRRLPNASDGLLDRLLADVAHFVDRRSLTSDIVQLNQNEFAYRAFSGPTHTMTRSVDPELLRVFDRLSAGESP